MWAICTVASAQGYAYLTVGSDGGSTTSFAIDDINRMTIEDGKLVMWNQQERFAELPLMTLDRMFFSATNGITARSAQPCRIRMDGGVLRITAPRGTRITLYNMSGQLLKEVTASAEETELSVNGLRKGAYIVKAGDEARKILSK
jgi:hypothetical protein